MLFIIDVDQTIAGGFKAFVEYHNQDLGLGISPQVLDILPDYRSFLHLPEVIAYRQTNETQFQASRARSRVSPQVILSLQELPEAVAGVNFLSQFGNIRYYTIRSNEVQEATKQWLTMKQFPNPQDVIFCKSSRDKLVNILVQETQETVVLIDDKGDVLTKAFEEMAEHPHITSVLWPRLVIVAFGIEEHTLPVCSSSLKVLALPAWDKAADLAASLGLNVDISL